MVIYVPRSDKNLKAPSVVNNNIQYNKLKSFPTMKKHYITPTVKAMPVALQQLLCGSPLDINDDKVDNGPSEGEKPKNWGTIW